MRRAYDGLCPPAAAAFLIAASTVCFDAPRAEDRGPSIAGVIESPRTVYYPGEDLILKMIFRGGGDDATLEPDAFAREAFTLKDSDGNAPRKVSDAPSRQDEQGPLVLRGVDRVERQVNLSAWYPKLTAKTGSWEIAWSHGAMKAGPIKVQIVKAYRADKDTTATVETDLGTMTWELMPAAAPEHVKHFVDLARSGFYDGLTIFRVVPGLEATGGDPKGDGTGAWSRVMNPEMSTKVLMGVGLIGASRQETSMTSDSMFFITMGSSEYMVGRQTFYARITHGLDIIPRLNALPTRGDTSLSDSYQLLTPVVIRRITIE